MLLLLYLPNKLCTKNYWERSKKIASCAELKCDGWHSSVRPCNVPVLPWGNANKCLQHNAHNSPSFSMYERSPILRIKNATNKRQSSHEDVTKACTTMDFCTVFDNRRHGLRK